MFLRTFSPTHFEHGDWTDGGSCPRTRPFGSDEKKLEGYDQEFFVAQEEEFLELETGEAGSDRSKRLRDRESGSLSQRLGHAGTHSTTFLPSDVLKLNKSRQPTTTGSTRPTRGVAPAFVPARVQVVSMRDLNHFELRGKPIKILGGEGV